MDVEELLGMLVLLTKLLISCERERYQEDPDRNESGEPPVVFVPVHFGLRCERVAFCVWAPVGSQPSRG